MSVIVPATALAVSSATVAVRKPHPDSVRNCSPANLPLVSSAAWSHRGLISIYRRPAVLPCVLACLSSSSSSGSSSSLPKETISSASTKLFVSGLSFRTTEESLRNAFEKFGQLTEVNLVMDKIAKRPRGFAFLHYATEEESKKAIEGMHGKFLDGRVIFVEKAKPRSEVRNKGSPIRC